MLTPFIIQQLAAIDQANMAGMMEAMGIEFDIEKRKLDIAAELQKGIRFIVVEQSSKVQAYLSYSITDDVLKVKSIQLAPHASRFALKYLLIQIYATLVNEPFSQVRSKVFTSNTASILLHKKLGFNVAKAEHGMIEYALSKQAIIERLRQYYIAK